MKTLVLNIDRDDDFGRKAKVESPIIGYDKNLEAANKLGQKDAEDSDLNAIFYAISIYNELKKENKNVEIATICGHINVGFKSDEILAGQLEQVIEKTGAEDVILISDGAEDEHILPLIQSRIKITSINRVSVKQSREIEDTYYRVMKILEDEKVLKQFVLPLALVLIVWSFFTIIGMSGSGTGAIVMTLGLFLIIRAFKWERNISRIWENITSGFLTGKLSIYTYVISLVVLIAFGIYAYTNTDFEQEFWLLPVLSFVCHLIGGIVIAGMLVIFGRALDTYVHDNKLLSNYYMAPFSLLAFGFISYASLDALYWAFKNTPASFTFEPFQQQSFILFTLSGILILVIGSIIYRLKKENDNYQENEEKKGKKVANKN
jgi:putative membrane protein